eukprot:2960990-Rhodomonas_salina.1
MGDLDDVFCEPQDAKAVGLAHTFNGGELLPPESLIPAHTGISDTQAVHQLLQELISAMLHWNRRC